MIHSIPGSRAISLITGAGCFGLIAFALFMEHVLGLEPCALCILQRIMVILTGFIAVAAAIHNPGLGGIRIYGVLGVLSAVTGAGIAIRHLWLQSLPADQVPACGASLDYLLEVFPLTDVLAMVLTADGSCAKVLATFMGLSIPGWTLIAFAGLIAINIFQIARPVKSGTPRDRVL